METKTQSRSWYQKLQEIDVRYAYLLIIIVVSLPLLQPLKIPIGTTSEETMRLYQYIDNLPSRSVIVMIADQSPAAAAECQPGMIAIFYHSVTKGLRVLFYASSTASAPFIEDAMRNVLGKTYDHPDYGKLYVNLGYIPQGDIGLKGLASNIFFKSTDAYGNKTQSMEFFRDLPHKNAYDWKLVIYYGANAIDWVVRLVTDPYGCPTGGGVAAVLASKVYPYYPQKVVGFLTGLKGSAEYEILVNRAGAAVPEMDAQSTGHLAVIILIILGNVGYAISRRKTPRGG